jgi:hypothetical protein
MFHVLLEPVLQEYLVIYTHRPTEHNLSCLLVTETHRFGCWLYVCHQIQI